VRDITHDVVVSASIIDETSSPFILRNVDQFLGSNHSVLDLIGDGDFVESNLKHTLNGFLFCNFRLSARVGDRIRVHFLSVGTALDMHTIAIRDHTVLRGPSSAAQRLFAVDSYAGSTKVVDFLPNKVGNFVIQCDVHDHHDAGMVGIVTITT
jgi:hephaestin